MGEHGPEDDRIDAAIQDAVNSLVEERDERIDAAVEEAVGLTDNGLSGLQMMLVMDSDGGSGIALYDEDDGHVASFRCDERSFGRIVGRIGESFFSLGREAD